MSGFCLTLGYGRTEWDGCTWLCTNTSGKLLDSRKFFLNRFSRCCIVCFIKYFNTVIFQDCSPSLSHQQYFFHALCYEGYWFLYCFCSISAVHSHHDQLLDFSQSCFYSSLHALCQPRLDNDYFNVFLLDISAPSSKTPNTFQLKAVFLDHHYVLPSVSSAIHCPIRHGQ